MSISDADSRPARQLVGHVLPGGWRVLERIDRKPTDTGSCFSTGYIVEDDEGRRGFLKAMDYLRAFIAADTAGEMKKIAETFVFERDLSEKCRNMSMRRVVHAIDSGEVTVIPGQPHTKVSYLIFELADGDIRSHLNAQDDFDLVFVLRALHHVAVGLQQLHLADMAHQDLKPSNVLVYESQRGAKVGDLGRAWSKELPAPHDNAQFAGDPGYTPPEVLLGFSNSTAEERVGTSRLSRYAEGS
jgi:serine/threonine protein kinase